MAFAQVIPKRRLGTAYATFQSRIWIGVSLKWRPLSKTGKTKSMFHDLGRKERVARWNILEQQAQTMARKNSRPFGVGGGQTGKI